MDYQVSRHRIAIASGGELHLTRFRPTHPRGLPVLCWHGAIESGRIFHSRSGKGLAPWLAQQGRDVMVIDQRGRGSALPRPARGVSFSQRDVIVEEITAALARCCQLGGVTRCHVMAHSWGGVLIAAHLARVPGSRDRIASQVYFGTKRRVRVQNPSKWLYIDVIWKGLAPAVRRLCGYLPARRLRWGSDDEYAASHAHSVAWVRDTAWRDPEDGFDYAEALAQTGLPPTLHLAGSRDRALGHPRDVARFIDECGPHRHALSLLGRTSGLTRDYGHLDMLTHPHAATEVYPQALAWCQAHDDTAPDRESSARSRSETGKRQGPNDKTPSQ
ncbi:alpha/beta fold hydrolase [Chromohalobacter israelensis]|uniref:alpha/beta fold hydrolase n=1 Tax=Chromohalobacter israelensis TaxID=141390 RepID=UPI000D975C28|nr:alpha/beta fold hydrolase [Chromohalobacter salexigens]MBZ5875701.1 lysophospholipase [Chromohalobacter salexigens]PWW40148.1 serine aminopeptidase S33 family [Chromohalobacter salexigens]